MINSSKHLILHLFIFLAAAVLSGFIWPYLLLTFAQLVLVPLVLKIIVRERNWFTRVYPYIALPSYLAVSMLPLIDALAMKTALAGVYFAFTMLVGLYGIWRFLHTGFTAIEEFSITIGLIFLIMGGGWFLAYSAEWNTGYPPLITWLTAIHFHYSACLLPVFTGLLGRMRKARGYTAVSLVIILSPLFVAAGIAVSQWLEVLSVILYSIGIYGLVLLSFQVRFASRAQAFCIRTSFIGIAITIVLSLFFTFRAVSIDAMLIFHGAANAVIFGLFGIIGWGLQPPLPAPSTEFPVSKVRGKRKIGRQLLNQVQKLDSPKINGLVEDMAAYEPAIDTKTLSPAIIHFYENTIDYRLFAQVKWAPWFIPLAAVYRFFSSWIEQINLQLSRKPVEMKGGLFSVKSDMDGRKDVRAWVRDIKGKTAFVALYSLHTSDQTYMNIALPLPWSTMTGILALEQIGHSLKLTSSSGISPSTQAGIYLSFSRFTLKLPIEECFIVEEKDPDSLTAVHQMWIFHIPFLTIEYEICRIR